MLHIVEVFDGQMKIARDLCASLGKTLAYRVTATRAAFTVQQHFEHLNVRAVGVAVLFSSAHQASQVSR